MDEADPLVGKRIELLAMPDDPSPIEIGEQGTVRSVNQTSRGVQIGVDRIVRGQSCDSDFREWWTSAIRKTAEHYREGEHT